ncbi:uncharacterized protein LOC122947311 [Acropora millepora]|uniref:uncharacterized protein LOC122947311 n=2 Tax=Acropora TaxID=6127 RepID=UPI001CF35276|nr:uncharacterized protein LOC122947311 [Acropora millepora]
MSNRPEILITAMEICMAGSNKTGPESLFCPLNPTQRSSKSTPWLTMNMHNKIVDITRWITSNEILLKACNFTSYYWASFETILIHWTWQNTFDVMIAFWITDYCFMAVYVTIAYIKETMRRRRDARQLERELEQAKEEEELQRKLVEEERAQASGSQSEPAQGSGPPRKNKKHYSSNKEEKELQRKLVEEERA